MKAVVAMRCASAAAVALACAGLGSYAREVEATRAGLIGLEARDLRRCLGVPTDFAIDGDVEHQTFRFAHEDPLDASERVRGLGGAPIGDGSPSTRRYGMDPFPDDAPDPSYCQLDFDLVRGRVAGVLARGRTRDGVPADGSCMLRAEPCLTYAREDAPASDE